MNAATARLITLSLAGTCGVLTLIAIAQNFGVGRGYHWNNEAAPPEPLPNVRPVDREVASLPPQGQFADVQNRPLFNEDRKPTPYSGPTDDRPPEEVKPLNATLTGVIITPDVKLAMLKDNSKGDPVALRIGMPMPGEQAGWIVVDIQPRKILLKNANDETNELALEVSSVTPPATTPRTAPQSAPPPGAVPPPVPPPMAPPPPGGDPSAAPSDRAAELQKRIEERRREMREQAERLRQQQQQQQQQDKDSE